MKNYTRGPCKATFIKDHTPRMCDKCDHIPPKCDECVVESEHIRLTFVRQMISKSIFHVSHLSHVDVLRETVQNCFFCS